MAQVPPYTVLSNISLQLFRNKRIWAFSLGFVLLVIYVFYQPQS